MADIIGFITWNANPEIFRLGSFSVRWYGLLFATGFLIGYYIGEKMFKWEKVNPKWLDSLFIYLILATIVGARLGHVIFYGWDFYSQHPWEIIKTWHGGLASHGGAIGIMVALIFYSKYVTKRSILWTLDRVVVPTALVAAMIRTGNLMNSEIYGLPTTLPWGFIFEKNGETVAKHPTQIYEALCYLFGFGLLMFMYWKGKAKDKPGKLLGVFFIIVFFSRFLIEFVKENQEAFEANMSLNMGQWLSIPFVVAGIWLVVRAIKKPPVYYENEAVGEKTAKT
jgi:phosphatidylglycerol---prolipoprotein diacylglyceryl transferase